MAKKCGRPARFRPIVIRLLRLASRPWKRSSCPGQTSLAPMARVPWSGRMIPSTDRCGDRPSSRPSVPIIGEAPLELDRNKAER